MNQVIVVGDDHTAHIRTVQLGPQEGKNIVISKGLSAGELVVTEGLDKIKDGMKVVPQPDTNPATAPSAGQNSQGN
jgi:multidrug efflux pump subunit AcrA (membrane-fusion protein)